MRAGASLGWRVATAVAFAATAALAVTLSRGAPIHVALTSEKNRATQHTAAPRPPIAGAACAESGLRISLGPGARVTTVITRYPLDFTNVSDSPCTLAGYPEVSAYRGDGIQVGPVAAQDTSVADIRVLLAPGETAHAALDAQTPAARCRPVSASGLRVVTPGQTGARYVRRALTACAARASRGGDYLSVRAIQPGTGISVSAGGSTGTVADLQPSAGPARRVTPASPHAARPA
jgi:Protein of unknown function (DUF4232)